jgi:hypothetical protein
MIAAKQTAYLMTRALPSCIFLVVINTALIFLLPPSSATMDAYNLSSIEYKIISFAISLPSYIVWFAAFIGYAKLLEYASTIRNTPEGKHYYRLARGGAWLAWSLPLSKIFSTLLGGIENVSPEFHATALILGTYFSLILQLVAFVLIASATRSLANDARLKLSLTVTRSLMLAFILAGISYCYFVLKHLDMSSLSSSNNGYYLPVWILLLTIVIPYLYMWFTGLLSACYLTLLGMKVKGHFYKHAMSYLVTGIAVLLMGSIAIQYISNVQPRAGHVLLDARLALTLIFRIVQGFGFALIAVGAIKLKKIEEV